MAEERSNEGAEQRRADLATVFGMVRAATKDATRHITGYVPPAPSTAVAATETYTQQHGFGKINAVVATADLGTTQQHAGNDALFAQQAMLEMQKRPVMIQVDDPNKAKDGKGKEGASAEAATEKGAEAAPAVNAAVLTNLVEKDTRSRINEVTGQTTDQQQPAQQQQQAKAAEEAKKTAVVEPGKKVKLSGLDKSTADAVNNLQKQFGKGKDDKDKPKVGMVSNSSNKTAPQTPPVSRQKAPAHAGPRGK